MARRPVVIDYISAIVSPGWRIGRRPTRAIVVCVVLLGIGVLVIRFGPFAYERTRILYAQRECLNFELPPGALMYEEGAAGTFSTLSRNDYSLNTLEDGRWAAYYKGKCFGRLMMLTNNNKKARAEKILFLHGRTSKDGQERLVLVYHDFDLTARRGISGSWVRFYVFLFKPATVMEDPELIYERVLGAPDEIQYADIGTLRFIASPADETDLSHITIEYRINDKPGTVEAWLNDDGTEVLSEFDRSRVKGTTTGSR